MIRMLSILSCIIIIIASCNSQNRRKETHNIKNGVNDSTIIIVQKHKVDTKKTQTDIAENISILCECFLLDSIQIQLYDTIQGRVINIIENDTIAESYYSIKIIKQQGKWIKILAEAINTKVSGWLKFKNNYFGVYGANYIKPLKIYKYPSINSNVIYTFPANSPENPMNIINWQKNWVEIQVRENGIMVKGWIKKEDTCPSPYTTCN